MECEKEGFVLESKESEEKNRSWIEKENEPQTLAGVEDLKANIISM